MPYNAGSNALAPLVWSGTSAQAWNGSHVIVQYHNKLSGSSDYYQHGDLDPGTSRRFPHLFGQGPYNQYGYDAGIPSTFEYLLPSGLWKWNFMTEWPAIFQINVWGINPDKQPDLTFVFGDADQDSILDRSPPSALAPAIINVTTAPDWPYTGWQIVVNDATLRFDVVAIGSQPIQIFIFLVCLLVPIATAALTMWAYVRFYYDVKINEVGIHYKMSGFLAKLRAQWPSKKPIDEEEDLATFPTPKEFEARKTILIGTIEYDIEDWAIKIKIGGLGVMAQLMGKALTFQDLIWVVPCVGDVEYPVDTPAPPMRITILGKPYEVKVQYHKLRNITYVLLDAPIFRSSTKVEPYPARKSALCIFIHQY